MDWFVIGTFNNTLETFSDNEKGQTRVKNYIKEMGYDNDYTMIIRGERYEYIPPKGKAQLVKIAADK